MSKKLLALLLSVLMLFTSIPFGAQMAFASPSRNAMLDYHFEKGSDVPLMYGRAEIIYDIERESNVLYLDGSDNTYGKLPGFLFDGLDTVTISMDIKPQTDGGNFFTFAIGKDSTRYNFIRVRGSEIRNAITVNSFSNEREVKTSSAKTNTWMNLTVVIDGTKSSIYVNGALKAVNNDTGIRLSDLGTDMLCYLGKSLYDGDAYYKGCFDNIRLYDYALSDGEIMDIFNENAHLYPLVTDVRLGTLDDNISSLNGTDNHTALYSDITDGVITSIIRRGVVTSVPVTFSLINSSAHITVDGEPFVNGSRLNLSSDRHVVISYGNRQEEYTLRTPTVAVNSILPGQYADPDIDFLNGKFWIYPTTDGTEGWGGTQFHAWSSPDLVNWTDEGVILDVADNNPGLNAKGVQIASSAWSDGNAWAPTIEEKNGKYYFYYCGRIKSEYLDTYAVRNGDGNYNDKAIGVAIADSPSGPFVASAAPLVYPKMMSENLSSFGGQVIDPSIFTDDDGTSYLLFGNGSGAIVPLNSNMTSFNPSNLKKIEGMNDFRESVVLFKRNGTYYFTWSCDDTGSENYHVKYGTATKITASSSTKYINVSYKGPLLRKDTGSGILGTGHQDTLYLPAVDRLFIVYHRFYTPLGIFGSSGCHRETCIDEISFGSSNTLVEKVPTMQSLGDGICPNGHNLTVTNYAPPTCESDGVKTVRCNTCGYEHTYSADEIPALRAYGHQYYSSKHNVSCAQDGYTQYRCSLCGDIYKTDFVSAYGHTLRYVDGTAFDYKCDTCDETVTKTADELRAMWEEHFINKAPQLNDTDNIAYFELKKDGIINAKDFAKIIKNK